MENEMLEKICNLRSQFDVLCQRHSDDESLVDAIKNACKDFSSVEDIRKSYQQDNDMTRLLRIGIVGRVKAGKSSLLNSLIFDGKDILPKAATPMTAALTYLEYGETVSVKIEFFTEKDIQKLKADADDYENSLKRKADEQYTKLLSKNKDKTETELKDSAKTHAEIEMKKNIPLFAAYDQYQKIKNSSAEVKEEIKQGEKIISVNSINDIAFVLKDYVGESGKYMPFTRNVNITLPLETLKDVSIVDTPGFNDPVPSRDDKARELLRKCDVVLILTLANQSLSSNDTDVLSKITTKNGIQEIFIVLSQFDSTLFGNEVLNEVDGDLNKAINMSKENLSEHIKTILSGALNSDGVFNSVINDGEKRVFHSSGMCQSMLQTWSEKENWDSGKSTVWRNLKSNYPDYFCDIDESTSKNSLEFLGNIKSINESIEYVKQQKDNIFKEKLAKFEQKHLDVAEDSKKSILEYIDQRKNEIKTRKLDNLEKAIERIQIFASKIEPALKGIFVRSIADFYNFTSNEDCMALLDEHYKRAEEGISRAQGSDTRHWTTGHLLWKEDHHEDYTTVKTSEVENSIGFFIDNFNTRVNEFLKSHNQNFTLELSSRVAQFWLENASEEAMRGQEIEAAVSSLIQELITYDIKYDSEISFSNKTGLLKGDFAEEFLDEAKKILGGLKRGFSCLLYTKFDETREKLYKTDFAKRVLEKYENAIQTKKKEAEAPKKALKNLDRIKKEVENIK